MMSIVSLFQRGGLRRAATYGRDGVRSVRGEAESRYIGIELREAGSAKRDVVRFISIADCKLKNAN